jgi:hypothetical protein
MWQYDGRVTTVWVQVDAGGEVIITQLFYEVELFLKFVKDCRSVGITVPILPGEPGLLLVHNCKVTRSIRHRNARYKPLLRSRRSPFRDLMRPSSYVEAGLSGGLGASDGALRGVADRQSHASRAPLGATCCACTVPAWLSKYPPGYAVAPETHAAVARSGCHGT